MYYLLYIKPVGEIKIVKDIDEKTLNLLIHAPFEYGMYKICGIEKLDKVDKNIISNNDNFIEQIMTERSIFNLDYNLKLISADMHGQYNKTILKSILEDVSPEICFKFHNDIGYKLYRESNIYKITWLTYKEYCRRDDNIYPLARKKICHAYFNKIPKLYKSEEDYLKYIKYFDSYTSEEYTDFIKLYKDKILNSEMLIKMYMITNYIMTVSNNIIYINTVYAENNIPDFIEHVGMYRKYGFELYEIRIVKK